MLEIQNDEKIIEKLYSYLITEFPRLGFKTKIPLKKLFPEPDNKWLKSFWSNNSHADISVFRHNKLVCIIEPGGSAHFKDKKQKIRDSKKDKICKVNGINCLRIANSVINYLDKKITRKLFKKYFYSMVRSGGLGLD